DVRHRDDDRLGDLQGGDCGAAAFAGQTTDARAVRSEQADIGLNDPRLAHLDPSALAQVGVVRCGQDRLQQLPAVADEGSVQTREVPRSFQKWVHPRKRRRHRLAPSDAQANEQGEATTRAASPSCYVAGPPSSQPNYTNRVLPGIATGGS